MRVTKIEVELSEKLGSALVAYLEHVRSVKGHGHVEKLTAVIEMKRDEDCNGYNFSITYAAPKEAVDTNHEFEFRKPK